MTEDFLYYLWQFKLFSQDDLQTTDGQSVIIVNPGQRNTDAGPDFFNAKIRIDETLWVGNVEVHLCSSDWYKHNHQLDPAYDNCILHVVLEADKPARRVDGSIIPSIELKGKYQLFLWENYQHLMSQVSWIPCQSRIQEVDEFTVNAWLERVAVERLEQKTNQVVNSLIRNKGDWEETLYQHIGRNFGFRVNAVPFELLTQSIPFKLIRKHKGRLNSIESILFGQSGILNESLKDVYPEKLWFEYKGLMSFYHLKPLHPSVWKFMRLRPVNFPTIRISQFAALMHQQDKLFSKLIEFDSIKNILECFDVKASEYWDSHYLFDTPSVASEKIMGKHSIENLFINTIIPFLFAWGRKNGENGIQNRALDFLGQIAAEENQLIRKWKEVGVKANSALQTQALLQLKFHHCDEKKCLQCGIGNKLINSSDVTAKFSI